MYCSTRTRFALLPPNSCLPLCSAARSARDARSVMNAESASTPSQVALLRLRKHHTYYILHACVHRMFILILTLDDRQVNTITKTFSKSPNHHHRFSSTKDNIPLFRNLRVELTYCATTQPITFSAVEDTVQSKIET